MYKVRLIDAVNYRKELEKEKDTHRTAEELMGLEIAIADLGDMPTIDPIHAIGGCYCFECENCKDGYCLIRKDSWGEQLEVGLHDFCSNGKNKNKNND